MLKGNNFNFKLANFPPFFLSHDSPGGPEHFFDLEYSSNKGLTWKLEKEEHCRHQLLFKEKCPDTGHFSCA